MADPPTIEDCCKDSRDLKVLKQEVDKILGPHEQLEDGMKRWAQCMSPCGPNLPAYPCRGVIRYKALIIINDFNQLYIRH